MKLRLHFPQAHQTWTTEEWKNVSWSDDSWFLLQHLDGMVRIWCKQYESMDPSYLVSIFQDSAGVMHRVTNDTRSPDLSPIEHLWDEAEREIHITGCAVDKSAATVWRCRANMDQNRTHKELSSKRLVAKGYNSICANGIAVTQKSSDSCPGWCSSHMSK